MPNDLYNDLPLTNFPSSLDTFTTWLNIVASDGILIAQYQAALQAGNQSQANQILAQIPQASQKIISAMDLNTLSQAMLAIERFYLTDIEPYITQQQQTWLTTIQQFSYEGIWQSGTSYVVNNLVSYTVSGLNLIYIATSSPPVGTQPTNTQYWRVLTIQGQSGTSGEGLSYRQEWNSSTQYSTNDAVTYDGAIWMALQESQNRLPDSSPEYWQLVMNLETTTYPIQATVPTNLQVDGLWFNTSNNPTQYIYSGDVQDGYTLIANAITNKGVPTEATDTPAQMAENIGAIQTEGSCVSLITGSAEKTGSGFSIEFKIEVPLPSNDWNYVSCFFLNENYKNFIAVNKQGEAIPGFSNSDVEVSVSSQNITFAVSAYAVGINETILYYGASFNI